MKLILILFFPFCLIAQSEEQIIEDFCTILKENTMKTWGLDTSNISIYQNYISDKEVKNLIDYFQINSIFKSDSTLELLIKELSNSKKKSKLNKREIIHSCLSNHFLFSKVKDSKWIFSMSEKIQIGNQKLCFINIYVNPKQTESMYAELTWLLIFNEEKQLEAYYFYELIS